MKALNIKEAKPIVVEHYRELSTTIALRECKNTEEVWKFVPDHWASGKSKKSHKYLWSLLATMAPEWTKQVVQHAQEVRRVKELSLANGAKVVVCEEVRKMLSACNF